MGIENEESPEDMQWEKDIQGVLGMTVTEARRLVQNRDEFHRAVRGTTSIPG